MRFALLAALALAACSSDPAPSVDSGPADLGPIFVDVGPAETGADAGVDRPSPLDLGPADVGDEQALIDHSAPDAPDVGTPDAGVDVAVGDAPAADAVDAQAVDAGSDAVAVADAGERADRDEIPTDRPPAADVVDAGPVDGGPVTYDLSTPRSETSAVLLFQPVCSVGCAGVVCDATATPGECRLASDGLHFFVDRCGMFTGLTSVGGAGSVAVQTGAAATQANMVVTTQGPAYVTGTTTRRNFHVQFSAPAGSSSGVTGIPGRTVSPTLGDLWLFGCRVE